MVTPASQYSPIPSESTFPPTKTTPCPPDIRAERIVYSKLMDHLDDIETKNRHWLKYVAHAVELFVFSGLVAALVFSLAVEPTNRHRLLHLRIWQWVTMAIMITAVFSVVPFFTFLLSWPLKFLGRTHKYWVYFIRGLKRSVDYTLWSGLVLLGWYAWFRPRLKHVYGDVSVIVCQQITRLLIALCIGTVLWTFKHALYLKLRADLHYDQLFDRIGQTIVFLNGFEILEKEAGDRADFLEYDEEMLDEFGEYEKVGNRIKQMGMWMRYVMKRKWKIWSGYKKNRGRDPNDKLVRCRNIWMDVKMMKRENVPIWILVRLSHEYLERVKVLSKAVSNVDELINDDHQLLEKAKQMFKNITGSTKQDIDQFDEIELNHLADAKYNLSTEELKYLFKPRQNQVGEENNNNPAGEINNSPNQMNESNNTRLHTKASRSDQQGDNTPYKAIEVDKFLNWAVRVHKNCWGLERTLKSSRIAFVKLNRMLSAFLIVLVVIIWLLLSKIVNTGQLALLFAPFLAASFMFENSSKNMLNGIIFAFAMHPFDVGDRVIIEDIQMRVKKLNILTSVFYKYDTGAEVIFPNSKLASTKIVNLDITPDQSDKMDFVIDAETPLEDIKHLELKLQKLLDENLFYASGTKVVKNAQNPETPKELKMTIHFKYLVSYLTAEKKAAHKSDILSIIMRFHKEMEGNKKEYPLDHKPYVLELTTNKVKLSEVERFKRHILTRLEEKYCKAVMTDINDDKNKIEMALYVGCPKDSNSEEKMQDHIQPENPHEMLISSEITDEKNFFANLSFQEYGYSAVEVTKDGKPIYSKPEPEPEPEPNNDAGLTSANPLQGKQTTATTSATDLEGDGEEASLVPRKSSR